MNILLSVFWVIVAIMILVFVHEMGHFLFAKLFKMRVDRFSIGFPPRIIGKKIGETDYMIGATPLGGYVKIAGMVDESMDTEFASSEPEPWEFRAKPVWQRIIVITAGVIFNVILAAFIFTGIKYVYGEAQPLATDDGSVYVADSSLAYGMGLRTGDRILALSGKAFDPYDDIQGLEALLADSLTVEVERDGRRMVFVGPEDIMTQLSRSGGMGLSFEPSVVGALAPGLPAEAAGLLEGDRILTVNDVPVRFWIEMTDEIQASGGAPLAIRYARDGAEQTVEITPQHEGDRFLIGISQAIRFEEYGLGGAVVAGLRETWVTTRGTVVSLKRMITGRENLRENLGGPVRVAQIAGQAAQLGQRAFWGFVAYLSIMLAIVNILPIPALDGGHLVFLLYEGITRREPSLRVRMVMQQVGMVLLLTLMVFLVFNDILRL